MSRHATCAYGSRFNGPQAELDPLQVPDSQWDTISIECTMELLEKFTLNSMTQFILRKPNNRGRSKGKWTENLLHKGICLLCLWYLRSTKACNYLGCCLNAVLVIGCGSTPIGACDGDAGKPWGECAYTENSGDTLEGVRILYSHEFSVGGRRK